MKKIFVFRLWKTNISLLRERIISGFAPKNKTTKTTEEDFFTRGPSVDENKGQSPLINPI